MFFFYFLYLVFTGSMYPNCLPQCMVMENTENEVNGFTIHFLSGLRTLNMALLKSIVMSKLLLMSCPSTK